MLSFVYLSLIHIFSNIKILDYNIDNLKFRYELFGFVKMGIRLNKNIFRIIYAYIVGRDVYKRQIENDIYDINIINEYLYTYAGVIL